MRELARSAEQFGNTIRRIRKKCDMSQAELAEKSGLRQATISSIESGHPTVKLETVFAVLAALGLDIEITERKNDLQQNLFELMLK